MSSPSNGAVVWLRMTLRRGSGGEEGERASMVDEQAPRKGPLNNM